MFAVAFGLFDYRGGRHFDPERRTAAAAGQLKLASMRIQKPGAAIFQSNNAAAAVA